MLINKKRKHTIDKKETIWEMEARLKMEAIEISKTFVHTKPIKYLLK